MTLSISKVYKTEAIILKRTKLGEADKILTLYTPYMGKYRAVAKGVRRPVSKLGGHVELLARSQMMLARGQNLDIITQSQTIENFLPLREDLGRVSHAFYVAELMDAFNAERIENAPLYQLLLDTLRWLSESQENDMACRFFELRLLDYVGYRPQLRECVGCRKPLDAVTNRFSISGGGIFCPECTQKAFQGQAISPNALKVMRFLQQSDLDSAKRLRVSDATASEMEVLTRGYIQYLLERKIRSADFLDTLRYERSVSIKV